MATATKTNSIARRPDPILVYLTPTGATNFDLPTNIPALTEFHIVNNSSYDVTIRSSALNTVDVINKGNIKVFCVQDNPTSNAHWYVKDVYEEVTDNQSVVGANSSTATTTYRRIGKSVVASINITGTLTISGTPTNINWAVPSRLQPGDYGAGQIVLFYTAGAYISTFLGMTGGSFYLYKNINQTSTFSGGEAFSTGWKINIAYRLT